MGHRVLREHQLVVYEFARPGSTRTRQNALSAAKFGNLFLIFNSTRAARREKQTLRM